MLYFIFCAALFCAVIYELTTLFKSLSLIQALPYCIILLIGIQCVIYGALSFFAVGFNGYISAAIDLSLIAFCEIYRRKIKPDEKSEAQISISKSAALLQCIGSKADIAAFALNLTFIIALTLFHFGPEFSLAFLSGDSASHCSSMLDYANGAIANRQYVFGISGACMIDAVRHLVDPSLYYKCYVINEVFWFWLSVQMFYTLINKVTEGLNAVFSILLCFLYAFGYPFYSVVMGFGYFGASIAIVCAIFFTVTSVPLSNVLNLCCFSIILSELAVSYLLFVPPVFIASFFIVLFEKDSHEKKTLYRFCECVALFLLPCIFAVFLNYSGFFFSASSNTVGQSINAASITIARDGGSFKSLFADFIFIAPLALYGFITQGTQRKYILKLGLFPIIYLVYCIALFILCLFNIVSSYYFFKTYAILWMIFFVFTAIGIKHIARTSKRILVSYACIWLTILCFAVTGLDAKLAEKRPTLDPVSVSDQIFPLYRFNIDSSHILIFNEASLKQLREYADTVDIENGSVALLGENETRWFNTLGYTGKVIPWWNPLQHDVMLDSQTILDSINSSEFIYVDNTFYGRPYPESDYHSLDEVTEYIGNNYQVLFKTDYGTVYQLHEPS